MRSDLAKNALSVALPDELAKNHEFYDPDARLLKRERRGRSEGGEGASTVHPLRPSLSYAVALLDAGDRTYRDRAVGIVEEVVGRQADDPDDRYFGCWPYYAEQSLSELSRVDLNWALFLGRELITLLDDHADRLSGSLVERVETALRRAAICSRDRGVNPGYTNIAAMNAYVLTAAGTLLADDELLDHGRGKLREFVGYTRYHDGFTEYNSPTYTVITLGEVGRMMAFFDDESDLALANALNDYAWRSLATHYHPPTAKLAGPHSRAYDDEFHDDVGGTSLRSIVYAGTGGEYGVGDEDELEFPENDPPLDLNWHRPVLDCPVKYYDGFEARGPEFVRDRFYDGADDDRPANELTPHEAPGPVEVRSYRTPTYSIGSFTKSHLWNQRRPLIGYWGDPAAPGYVRLRCLRDGADFLPAMLAASQYENRVLGAVNFVTDYDGLASDPETMGPIEVEELSVRFEVGTEFSRSADRIDVRETNDGGFRIETDDVTIDVTLLHSAFSPGEPTVNADEGSDSPIVRESVWVEVVLYDGEQTVVELDSVTSAAVLFGMTVRSSDDEAGSAAYSCNRLEDGRLRASMSDSQLPGRLTVPDRPRPYGEYFSCTTVVGSFNNRNVNTRSRR